MSVFSKHTLYRQPGTHDFLVASLQNPACITYIQQNMRLSNNFFPKIYLILIHVCVSAYEYSAYRVQKYTRSPGTRHTSSCELPDVRTGILAFGPA